MKRYLSLLCLFFGFTAFAQDPILVINDTEELTGDPISIVIGKRRLEPIKDINGINQGFQDLAEPASGIWNPNLRGMLRAFCQGLYSSHR